MSKDAKGHGSNGKAGGGFKYDPEKIRAEAKAARKADSQARKDAGMTKAQMRDAMAKKPEHRTAAEAAGVKKATDAFSASYGFNGKAEGPKAGDPKPSKAINKRGDTIKAEDRRIANAERKMR